MPLLIVWINLAKIPTLVRVGPVGKRKQIFKKKILEAW